MPQKVIVAVLVVFLGFWLFTDPSGLAETAQTAGGSLWKGTQRFFEAIIAFVGSF